MSHEVSDCILMEQRYVIRYCYRKGMTPAETIEEMQKIYKKKCYDESFILKLHKRYKEISTGAAPPKARNIEVSAEKVQEALDLVNKNKKITMKSISVALNISLTMAFTIMTDHLGMTMVGHEWTKFDDTKISN